MLKKRFNLKNSKIYIKFIIIIKKNNKLIRKLLKSKKYFGIV